MDIYSQEKKKERKKSPSLKGWSLEGFVYGAAIALGN